MKNQLSLHEAIVIALINIDKGSFSATFEEIAEFIEKRALYANRKGGLELATQVMLRSTKSKGAYHYLFHQVDENSIQLKSFPPVVKPIARRSEIVNGFDLADYMTPRKTTAKLRKGEQILR